MPARERPLKHPRTQSFPTIHFAIPKTLSKCRKRMPDSQKVSYIDYQPRNRSEFPFFLQTVSATRNERRKDLYACGVKRRLKSTAPNTKRQDSKTKKTKTTHPRRAPNTDRKVKGLRSNKTRKSGKRKKKRRRIRD